MAAFKLPRLKANLPIVNGQGKPLDYFLRLFNIELAQKIEQQEATQAKILLDLQAVQIAQQAEIDRLNRVLAGDEDFTGLQVSGQRVETFLEQTDGTKIVNTAGLGTGVVVTEKVFNNAITNSTSVSTNAILNLNGVNPVTVQTVTFASTGGPLVVQLNLFATIWHPSAGGADFRLRIVRSPVGNVFDQVIGLVGGDFLQGWQTPTIVETLPAGTYTWEAICQLSTDSGFSDQFVQNRFMSVTEFKR